MFTELMWCGHWILWMRFKIIIYYRYILFVINTDLNPERDNAMWKDKNKLKTKVVRHKRTVSWKKTTRQFTKFFILQNEPEPKRYGL